MLPPLRSFENVFNGALKFSRNVIPMLRFRCFFFLRNTTNFVLRGGVQTFAPNGTYAVGHPEMCSAYNEDAGARQVQDAQPGMRKVRWREAAEIPIQFSGFY